MAFMTSPRKTPATGCLNKLIFLTILILSSGILGWFAGKAWIFLVIGVNEGKNAEVFLETSNESNVSKINNEELQRKNKLRSRCRSLGLNPSLFVTLVDEYFSEQYPGQKGHHLSNNSEDYSLQKKWDQTAVYLLDILTSLSPEAVRRIGTYTKNDRHHWKQQVNNLHLSSRALSDLVDARFFQVFPAQKNTSFLDKAIGQIWNSMMFDTLQALQSSSIYEKLSFTAVESNVIRREATLKLGEGRTYVLFLEASDRMKFDLKANRDILLSIYSPTGDNNLIENYQQHQWSGILPETGYYEIIIVSHSKKTVNYQFQIWRDKSIL
jgi:serine/threonine protein kinase, bacterial